MMTSSSGRDDGVKPAMSCILPMVGSTTLPKVPRPRSGLAAVRLPEVVRGTVERVKLRLDRLADELREAAPARVAALLDGDRMRALAADVDGISRIIAQLGDLVSPDPPSARWVSPRGVIEAALVGIHRVARGPLPKIEVDVAEGHLVHADPEAVRRVLEALLSNAIEASGPDGEVVVTSVEYADAIEIEVADSGPGLAGPVKARLFGPGFVTGPDGVGLALAAASSLVDQLGGTIDAANCPEGGAAFTVRLPHGRRRRLAA